MTTTTTQNLMIMFDGYTTITEVNRRYKELFAKWEIDKTGDRQLYWALSDAHRRVLEALTVGKPQKTESLDDPNRVSPRALRNWALREGLPLAKKGRVGRDVENAYRVAHELPLLDDGIEPGSPADIRRWARENDIPVSSRGRVHPTVIAQYNAAKEGMNE